MANRVVVARSDAKVRYLMATYYVGAGGNDSNNGTTWALRKLTLNGAEDIPVQAGDTVYVGAGTYREQLTCDVSGSSGSPISYIGDYDGSHTDGTGGVVRITGSNDDTTVARNIQIALTAKAYRTFKNFCIDSGGSIYASIFNITNNCDHLIVDGCSFNSTVMAIKSYSGSTFTNTTIKNCVVVGAPFYNTGLKSNDSGNVIENNLIVGAPDAAISIADGGTVIRNCTFIGGYQAVNVGALNAGQTVTVNNCIMIGHHHYQLIANTLGMLIEDYNYCTSRSNVAIGEHSINTQLLFDHRFASEMINGGSMLSPFDLASYSQLINVAGTSPTTADIRGTTVQGTQREWGALEYDSTLDIEAGTGGGLLTNTGMSGGMRG